MPDPETEPRESKRTAAPVLVGGDRVVRKSGRLVVHSRANMPDWEVRRYRKVMIRYEGERFFPSSKAILWNGSHRYVLEPWPADSPDPPSAIIDYGLDYVKARDEAETAMQRHRRKLLLVAALLPLVGFLPSSYKAALNERWGVHPQSATSLSLFLEYLAVLAASVLLAIDVFTGIFNFKYLVAVIVVFGVDAWVRKDSLLAEEMNPPGFYEWLFRIRLR